MRILRAAFLVTLMLPVGCSKTDDCGSAPSYINIIGITGQNVRLSGDSYRNEEPLPDEASVSFATYALRIIPTAEYTNQRAEMSGRWGNTVYACSPALPEPTDTVADIAVFSNTAYQQANSSKVIAPGERLNNIVKIYDRWSGRITGLPDFLLDERLASDYGFLLQFTAAPAEEATHTFTVRYELNSGETYEFTAPPVTLAP